MCAYHGNKRKVPLKLDTPRIVCHTSGYSKRKVAAGRRVKSKLGRIFVPHAAEGEFQAAPERR